MQLVTKPVNVTPQAKCQVCDNSRTILVKTDRGMQPVACPACSRQPTNLVTKGA